MSPASERERDVGSWVERLARLGYLVKGVVYVTVGLLAIQVALGLGGRTTGASGALVSLSRQPFGTFLIGIVAVGLLGYSMWRLVQAVFDVEAKGRDPRGLLKRFGYLLSGLAYGTLALEAWRLLLRLGVSSDSDSQELWTARILSLPWGRVLVVAGALVMFGLALNAGIVAFRRLYRDKLQLGRMSRSEERLADVAAMAGLLGRGSVFGVIGIFLWRAALLEAPGIAGSSAEALDALATAPYGMWLLGGVAVGLLAYGAFAITQARYREMDV